MATSAQSQTLLSSGCLNLFLILCISLKLAVHVRSQENLPNIVFIVADDLGWNDIGFNNPDIISPNIDSLAKSGVILNQSYVQPLCSPSRSAFMTGYYPFRLGFQHIVLGERQNVCVALDKIFLPQLLKKQGYATYGVGKWHLGFCKWECTPLFRGFDSFVGYFSSREDYYSKLQSTGYDFRINEDTYWEANGTYSLFLYQSALKTIINNHDPQIPMFLYIPAQSVHEPLEVPDYYYNLYPNIKTEGRRIFSGMVTALDDTVGLVVDLLKKRNLYNNTIIFFTSDNGGAVPFHGNNYPFRGAKSTIWEGGTRVPAFVHGKFLQKTGVRYDGLMHAVDWSATIAEAAKIPFIDPDSDGVSLWQSIISLSPSKRSEIVYNLDNETTGYFSHAAIRVGDYKLILGVPGPLNKWYQPDRDYTDADAEADSVGNWTTFKGLFNLKDDPCEHLNLYNQLPDVVKTLSFRLSYHYTRMIPAKFPPNDPKADPSLWNGTWSPGWC